MGDYTFKTSSTTNYKQLNYRIMNKTIDTETLILKVESHEHRIGIMENLLRDAKQVLTLEEAALFMGISKSSLYKMTHKHELPFFRPNGKIIYFEKSELLNWMRQNRSMSEAETKAAATKHLSELCK
jgi:excisionase family DNA binding protein